MNDDTKDRPLVKSSLPFLVVGIGASAGGLMAVRRILETLPLRPGMAFVVVLHLSPKHESMADSVLGRSTRMPVTQVKSPVAIEPNHVYVISPRNDLRMVDGVLSVTPSKRPRGQHVAVDLFLRTLADVHGEKAVGIVLSGAGGDGSAGLVRVKEQGGVTIAQSPEDAEYADMPRNAIATGSVDFVLPAVDIAQKLIDLRDVSQRIVLPPAEGQPVANQAPDTRAETEQALREVLDLLLMRTGHDFHNYKRATVVRRIERRMQVNGVIDVPGYRDLLRDKPDETRALLDDMLISVTSFFRDRDAFEALERDVLPALWPANNSRPPRVWVTACATGEEAYSVAMLLSERAQELGQPDTYQIFASDIDKPAIDRARAGIYSASIVTDVPPARLRRFFTRETDRYRVQKSLRERVLFADQNVLSDPPFGRIDLICCRNLLIYLDREVQMQLLRSFHFALRPGGWLFLGNSESADSNDLFEQVDKRSRIYRARPEGRGVRQFLSMTPQTRHAPAEPRGRLPPDDAREISAAEIHRRILEDYASPSVVVDMDYQIVHSTDRAGRYLIYGAGEPTRHLLKIVLPELQRELRAALFQAIHSGKSVEAGRVRLERGEDVTWVTMVARPFRSDQAGRDFVLVLFDEVADTFARTAAESDTGKARDAVILRLEEELERAKVRLQTAIEQSEVAAEEHKAANEELQAINEELRSASEELETSKEELQSANEELTTVNTELKRTVDETAKVNDDLRNFIASVDVATLFLDAELRIKRFTPRTAEIFSLLPTDLGRPLLDITHRLDYPEMIEDSRTAFGDLKVIERQVESRDGRCYAARVQPYRTGENRIDGAVLSFFEITQLRETQRALDKSAGRIRQAATAARSQAIIAADAAGHITAWNDGAEYLFGYSAEDVLGQPLDLLYLSTDARVGLPARERDEARQTKPVSQDRVYVARDGSEIHCISSLTALPQAHGEGFLMLVTDGRPGLDEDRAAGERLRSVREQQSEVDSAISLKDEFVAVISHELKNPLNLISVNAEILARDPAVEASEVPRHALQTIRGAIRSQSKIIDDLLDMSRLRTGKFGFSPQPVEVSAVLQDLTECLRADVSAQGKTIELTGDLRPVLIKADPNRFEQILWNLLSNAVKFTPAGGVITVCKDHERDFVRIVVEDTGRGIEPHFLPRVWNLFSQAASHRSGQSGLGIGLHLARQLVEAHGGHVRAESAGLGKGAKFIVWMPRYEAPLPAAGPRSDTHRNRLAGVRLLVVDDAADAVVALATLLQLEGAEVRTAHDGHEALAMLDAAVADVVVSDLGMPGLDGFELARAVRNDPRYVGVRLIALSGYGRASDVAESRRAGFDTHIDKPVDFERLLLKILQLVRS